MGASDPHRVDCLGQLIGKPGRLYDPPTADPWSGNPGLNRTIEGEIIPRLMMLFDHQLNGSLPPAAKRTGKLMPVDLREFVSMVLETDLSVICDYVENLRDAGESLPDIYLSLLAPAAREMGDMWERDECSFTQVTLGVTRMHQVLLRFSACFCAGSAEDDDAAHSALIVPVPGEHHTFGLLMLADFFRRDGWNVWSGSPESESELTRLVESNSFDVVGCSVGTQRSLDVLPGLIHAMRSRSKNEKIKVIVGGRLFSEQPGLAESVGADATADDGLDAVRQAERLVGHER